MKPKTFSALVFGLLSFLIVTSRFAEAADIKMRIVVINPSTDKTQSKTIKNYLPKEVTPKGVKDAGGLEIEYDNEQGLYYVYKNDIPLTPGETKTFEVVIDDVWMVSDDKLQSVNSRVDNILAHLKDTPYAEPADLVAQTIRSRLEEIKRTQNDVTVSRQQHIAYYRDNLKVLDAIQIDIERLEKMLVAVGGPPNVQLMEKSKVDLKSPTQKTTWLVIFVILIFVMILAGAFFFTWQSQAKVTENIFKREKADSFSEFKKPEPPGA